MYSPPKQESDAINIKTTPNRLHTPKPSLSIKAPNNLYGLEHRCKASNFSFLVDVLVAILPFPLMEKSLGDLATHLHLLFLSTYEVYQQPAPDSSPKVKSITPCSRVCTSLDKLDLLMQKGLPRILQSKDDC